MTNTLKIGLISISDRASSGVYQDAGFTFDAGPTVITAPECIEELFALAGGLTGQPRYALYRLSDQRGSLIAAMSTISTMQGCYDGH